MQVRAARIEQCLKAFDQSEDFNLQLAGARDRAMNGGVERRCIATSRQDANAFHVDSQRQKSTSVNLVSETSASAHRANHAARPRRPRHATIPRADATAC